jgi:hypothetical protein
MRALKPKTIRVVVGGEVYYVDTHMAPAQTPRHVSITSPAWKPGAPEALRIDRIMRDGTDATKDLLPWTRRAIEDAVGEQVK